jgi:hypothetical protein
MNIKFNINVKLKDSKQKAISDNDRGLAIAIDHLNDEIELLSETCSSERFRKIIELKKTSADLEFEELLSMEEEELASVPMGMSIILSELEALLKK